MYGLCQCKLRGFKMTQTYQFTVVLQNVNMHTELLEDSLYESGCDDALINFRNGTVYLTFSRQAISLQVAVLSAIKDVESASIKPRVVTVQLGDFK